MSESRLPRDRDDGTEPGLLPLAPLLWAIGYSGLHVTVLLRAVMGYQHPELLGTAGFWVESLAIAMLCAALMTAGWGRKPKPRPASSGRQ